MDDRDDRDDDAMVFIIAFLLCVICATKVPEYRCENCNKVYKQEARYRTHIIECVDGDTPRVESVSATDFSELLRQNREMMELMRKQQETIHLLVSQLSPGLMVGE